jgi:hypothetical protein
MDSMLCRYKYACAFMWPIKDGLDDGHELYDDMEHMNVMM